MFHMQSNSQNPEGQHPEEADLQSNDQEHRLPAPGPVIEEGVIIVIGPPASGKGTQCKELVKQSGLPHIAVGQMLRDEVARGTDRGKEVQEYMDKGELAPDELVTEVLKERLQQADCAKGFILDGYPRNLKQKELLDELLLDEGFPVPIVVELTLSEDEAVRRALGRKDGRTDDTEETVRNRQRVFRAETAPVIADYEQDGRLRKVSSEGSIEEVSRDVLGTVLEAQEESA